MIIGIEPITIGGTTTTTKTNIGKIRTKATIDTKKAQMKKKSVSQTNRCKI